MLMSIKNDINNPLNIEYVLGGLAINIISGWEFPGNLGFLAFPFQVKTSRTQESNHNFFLWLMHVM